MDLKWCRWDARARKRESCWKKTLDVFLQILQKNPAFQIKTECDIPVHKRMTRKNSGSELKPWVRIRDVQICLFFQKKWLFDFKNWGSFVLQQTRKVGPPLGGKSQGCNSSVEISVVWATASCGNRFAVLWVANDQLFLSRRTKI